jgi:hypothetical protein
VGKSFKLADLRCIWNHPKKLELLVKEAHA